jgi:hypothetical protein
MKAKIEANDLVARAFRREREARRWPGWQSEVFWQPPSLFKCVCCGRQRSDADRREPDSEVCLRCVRAAGYWN